MSRELIIPFESFNERGIQKKVISNIEKNFFYNIYLQAFQIIEQIDKTNDRNLNDKQEKLNDFQNVIAFTGRRGTGKTSSMLSFMETLVNGHFENQYFQNEKFNFVNKGFYALPYTDASMMSKCEDIFEVVLSKMLSCLNEEFTDFNKSSHRKCIDNKELLYKKIHGKICEIYNNYSSLKKSSGFSSSAPYNIMEMLSDKHNVRSDFISLVKVFTENIGDFCNKKVDYLIICIDDIDMTQNNHMDIMQCIHQYFMIPNIIVLVSFNTNMLSATLHANFYSNVHMTNSRNAEYKEQMDMTRNQTYDFIRKIIPADMRINMPSWKKKDYRELFPIQIDFTEHEIIEKEFTEIVKCDFYKKINESDKKIVTPKELIMLMLADRTSIYLDICGFKLHFMQPDCLRGLSDMFYLIYNMKFCNESKETDKENNKENDDTKNIDCQKRRENRKILLDYLHFKMLPENNFSSKIRNFIDDFLSSPMERRGRMIWNYYFGLLSSNKNRKRIIKVYGKEFYEKEINRFKIEKYSLGSLYRVLYSATRLNVLDRKVAIFLLASFSFSVPQFIEEEKKQKLDMEDKRKKSDKPKEIEHYSCKRLREAFRYSLIGTWCENLFGGEEGKSVNLVINVSKFKKEWNKKNNNEMIKYLVYAFMLSSCSTLQEIENSSNDYIINAFELKIDPTAFIVNSYAFDHRMKKTKLNYKNEKIYIVDFINCITGINIIEKQEGKEKSLYDQINEELNDSKKFPDFLLKHTDLSYNVMKRVMSEMIYSSDNDASSIKDSTSGNPFDVIKKFYMKLAYELERQDKSYLNIMKQEGKEIISNESFIYKFKKNPIVSMFLNKTSVDLADIGIKFV